MCVSLCVCVCVFICVCQFMHVSNGRGTCNSCCNVLWQLQQFGKFSTWFDFLCVMRHQKERLLQPFYQAPFSPHFNVGSKNEFFPRRHILKKCIKIWHVFMLSKFERYQIITFFITPTLNWGEGVAKIAHFTSLRDKFRLLSMYNICE